MDVCDDLADESLFNGVLGEIAVFELEDSATVSTNPEILMGVFGESPDAGVKQAVLF